MPRQNTSTRKTAAPINPLGILRLTITLPIPMSKRLSGTRHSWIGALAVGIVCLPWDTEPPTSPRDFFVATTALRLAIFLASFCWRFLASRAIELSFPHTGRSSQFLQQRLSLLEVKSAKPPGKPAVALRQQLMGFGVLALALPQATQAQH